MKTINKTLIFFIILLIIGYSLRGRISGDKFNSEKWRNSDFNVEENWTLRWDMMNNSRNNYKLVGKSEYKIIKLLGKPIDNNNSELTYSLGYTGTGINTGLLTVVLNSKRIVTDIKVHQG